MTARCASCSYPLSIVDSVSCYECSSYFHIDCAQLVGFPCYELSSDPNRNTFHCSTCKILPLPRLCDSDSDSDCDYTMPSRQLDYHMEGQPDIAKEINEMKGSVQDLSELCKDMLREINDLKSINLTLRCCVENLRHDNEQRDGLIAELKRRIETLERKKNTGYFKPIQPTLPNVDRTSDEKEEDVERYLTPDPEYSSIKDQESIETDKLEYIQTDVDNEPEYTRHKNQEWGSPRDIEPRNVDTDNNENIETEYKKQQKNFKRSTPEDIEVQFVEEELILKSIDEVKDADETVTSVEDWDWKGSKAIPLEKREEEQEEGTGEEEESEESELGDIVTQGWEMLNEVQAEQFTKQSEKYSSGYKDPDKESDVISEDDESRSEDQTDERRVTWAEDLEIYDEDDENNETEKELSEETSEFYTQLNLVAEGEDVEEKKDETGEAAEKTSLKDEERAAKSPVEGGSENQLEELEGTGEELRLEGEPHSEGVLRLEGEPPAEGDISLEGEQQPGGQSPLIDGEVQPAELCEIAPTPEPEHSPEDLWLYLKESVSGEHPTTVEEFVQKLIGTLEHVPEEYLKPVINANIKRANTPSVTDGEHLTATDEEHLEGEQTGSEEALPVQEGDAFPAEGTEAPVAEGESAVAEEEMFNPKESVILDEALAPKIPGDQFVAEDQLESVEGYSAYEAAA